MSELIRHLCVANHTKKLRDDNFSALMAAYPTFSSMDSAAQEEIEAQVFRGGLVSKKAMSIKYALAQARQMQYSLQHLKDLTHDEAAMVLLNVTGFKDPKKSQSIQIVLNYVFDQESWRAMENKAGAAEMPHLWHGKLAKRGHCHNFHDAGP